MLVPARVWRRKNELLGAAALTEAFSAIINCFAQEYGTSSTTNDEGDHCEKQEGGCQKSSTCSVEYSSVGSKTDGAESSVMVLGAGSVLLGFWPDGTIAHRLKNTRRCSCCSRSYLP